MECIEAQMKGQPESSRHCLYLQLPSLRLPRAWHSLRAANLSFSQGQSQAVQTSACSAHCCRASGTMLVMLTLATSSSSLKATTRLIGSAISALMGINTTGMQELIAEQTAEAVHTALVKLCALTTPLPARPHTLSRSGIQPETSIRPMNTQSAACILHTGCVPAATNG